MPSLPDTAVCLHCGYSLRGLPSNVCPECGKEFDPANPETWRDSSAAGFAQRMWRFLTLPPSWVHVCYVVIISAVFLWMLSEPVLMVSSSIDRFILLFAMALLPVIMMYVLKLSLLAVRFFIVFGGQMPARPKARGRWRWGVLPLCLVLVGSALWQPEWPFNVRFAVSRPFLEWKADQVASAGVADNRSGIIGLFWVDAVSLVAGDVKFEVAPGRAIIRDRKGWIWDQSVYRRYKRGL